MPAAPPKHTLADFKGTWAFHVKGPPMIVGGGPGPVTEVSGEWTSDDNGNVLSLVDNEFPGETRKFTSTSAGDQPGTDIQFQDALGIAGQILLRFHNGQKGGLFGPWFPFEFVEPNKLWLNGMTQAGYSYEGEAERIG